MQLDARWPSLSGICMNLIVCSGLGNLVRHRDGGLEHVHALHTQRHKPQVAFSSNGWSPRLWLDLLTNPATRPVPCWRLTRMMMMDVLCKITARTTTTTPGAQANNSRPPISLSISLCVVCPSFLDSKLSKASRASRARRMWVHNWRHWSQAACKHHSIMIPPPVTCSPL